MASLLLLLLFSHPVISDSFETLWIDIFQLRILEWVAFLSPGDLPNPGIKSVSPACMSCIVGRFFTTEPPGKPYDIHYTWNLTYKTERDSQTQRMNLWLLAGKDGKGLLGSKDGHVRTAAFKMDHQQGPTVQHRKLYSMLCGSL